MVMGFVGLNARLFMFQANTTEVHGLDGFLRTLDRRKDPARRERGLITGKPTTLHGGREWTDSHS